MKTPVETRRALLLLAMFVAVVCLFRAPLCAGEGEAAPAEGDAAEAVDPEASAMDAFMELVNRVQTGDTTVTEADVTKMLTDAQDLGRPFVASQAVKAYLKVNMSPSADVLRLAAKNAELSGNLRDAVTRYKTYLQKATPGKAASEAAADMYRLMLHFLGQHQDAYRFWRVKGESLRTTTAARKYDHYFINQAIRRNDYGHGIPYLVKAAGQATGANASLYRRHVFDLAQDLLELKDDKAIGDKGKHVDGLREAAQLLPADHWRRDYVELAVAYLDLCHAYYQQSGALAGNDRAAKQRREKFLQEAWKPVQEKMDAWWKKDPSLPTLHHIYRILSGGGDHRQWNRFSGQKVAFFRKAWDGMNDEEKRFFMEQREGRFDYHRLIGSYWTRDMVDHPWLTREYGMREAADYLRGKSADEIKQIAGKLKEGGSWVGAFSRILASSADPVKLIDNWMAQRGEWDTPGGWSKAFTHTNIFKAHEQAYNRQDSDASALRHLWINYYVKSIGPIIDRKATRDLLERLWQQSRSADPQELVAALEGLSWVPYAGNDRAEVFARLRKEFGRWTRDAQNRLKSLEKKGDRNEREEEELKTYRKLVGAIPTLKKTLDAVSSAKVHENTKAPTPEMEVARKIIAARRAKNQAEADKLSRELYGLVKGKAVPMKRSLLEWLSSGGTWELRTWLLEETLTEMGEKDDASGAYGVLAGMADRRSGWPDRIRKNDKKHAKAVNDLLTAAFVSELEKGRYRDFVFDWIRHTHKGHGWDEHSWGQAACEKLIEGDWYRKTERRLRDDWPVSLNYIWLIETEFSGLRDKYIYKNHFDGMVVEDAKKLGFLHWDYHHGWLHGRGARDGSGKVAAYVIAQWKANKDPFLGHEGKWRDALLTGGGRKEMLAYYEGLLKKGEAVSHIALGWEKLRFGQIDPREQADQRKAYFDAVRSYVEATQKYEYNWNAPTFSPLEKFDPKSLTNEELDTLLLVFESHMNVYGDRRDHRGKYSYEDAPRLLHEGLRAKNRPQDIFVLAPYAWKIAKEVRHGHVQRKLYKRYNNYLTHLVEAEQTELAATYAVSGEQIGDKGRFGSTLAQTLDTVRSSSVIDSGVIPVPISDPRYKLYKAQINFTGGSRDSAWKLYQEKRDVMLDAYKDFDIEFSTWIVERLTSAALFDEAKMLAQNLIRWVDDKPGIFTADQRGNLYMAFAGIPFGQKEYTMARARFETIRTDPGLRTTDIPEYAELRVAEVDRLTGNFDQAVQRLEPLTRKGDKDLKVEAIYQLALCKFDREEWKEAGEYVDRVLTLDRDHFEAKVLAGKISLQMKRLEHALDIDAVNSRAQKVIVPGEPLKVKYDDQNLAVVKNSKSIEIRAWTTSGDEEYFKLFPFADSKTDFRGQIPTVLGVPTKNDQVIQLLGDDKLHYDYSQAYKDRNNILKEQDIALDVRTDAELRASSGRILSEEELEELKILAEIRKDRGGLQIDRDTTQIKPGNNIYLRVGDGDMSKTDQIDRLTVSARCTSGDSIRAMELIETEPTSGVFEGEIVTTKASAVAFASDTMESSEPGFAISHKEYPAWKGEADGKKPKWFSVDLNDNVAVKEMQIIAREAGHKPTKFLLQASFDNETFRTVGAYPKQHRAWDGNLQLEVIPYRGEMNGRNAEAISPASRFDWGYVVRGDKKVSRAHHGFAMLFKPEDFSKGEFKKLRLRGDKKYLARIRGAFYIEEGQARIFTPKIDEIPGVTYSLWLDGEEVFRRGFGKRGRRDDSEFDSFKEVLIKGVHELEVFITSPVNKSPSFDLLINTDVEPYVEPIPTKMFSQGVHPEIARAYDRKGAQIEEKADGSGFDVTFPTAENARVVRLLFLDYQGKAPAVNKLHLTDAEGARVLPTRHDFRELRQNDTLEIVAGDRVTLQYKDPRPYTAGKEVYEAFMNVIYHDAELEASFVEYVTEKGVQVETYIPLVRFKRDEPVVVFINDPDRDESDKRDSTPFEVTVTGREPFTLEAMETKPHSGLFTARLFPMEESKKDRPNEFAVGPNDNLMITYLDKENVDPGVPWERERPVIQVLWFDPELRVYNTEIVDAGQLGTRSGIRKVAKAETPEDEQAEPEKAILVTRPEIPNTDDVATAYIGAPVQVEIVWPTAVLSPESTISLYAQTSTGRRIQAGGPAAASGGDGPAGMPSDMEGSPEGGMEEGMGPGGPGGMGPGGPAGPGGMGPGGPAGPGGMGPGGPGGMGPGEEPDAPDDMAGPGDAGGPDAAPAGGGDQPYDITVPGTIKVTTVPGTTKGTFNPPEGIAAVRFNGKILGDELEEGIFTFNVPTTLGDVPEYSPAAEKEEAKNGGAPRRDDDDDDEERNALHINGDDIIHIGFRYTDWNGEEHWITKDVKLIGSATLMALDEDYEEPIEGIHVGETVYYRLVNKMLDTSPARDTVNVVLESEQGQQVELTLRETFEHTGDFRGFITPAYAEEGREAPQGALGVKYGDRIYARYEGPEGMTLRNEVEVFKGADGVITAFTKRFTDEDMGVRTQFMVAEAFFELAKKHRALGQEDLSRREIAQGRRLLQEAVRDMSSDELKAQADYLLAELSLEFANDAENARIKNEKYLEALSLFTEIVSNNPDSAYAPKAQYKKALTFEKMGELDKACEEYVKLSYRYPDHKLVAETISRLGRYFWKKGTALSGMLKKLSENPDADPVEVHKLKKQRTAMFRTAGEVFSRLQARFPGHHLAGKTTVLAGQALIIAQEYEKAQNLLVEAVETYKEDRHVAPEAMYWAADCHYKNGAYADAYHMFKRLTWEFPATEWAKYARGRLTDERMIRVEESENRG